jgi:hypothetical protein
MKRIASCLLAAALLAPVGATTVSATACNVVASQVTGNGNFVDLDVRGCGYSSTHLRGSYTFAQIINILGRVVSGIYGNNHYYAVHNVGDNQIGVYVDGVLHRTSIDVQGNLNDVQVWQHGAPSNTGTVILGNANQVIVRTR